MKKQHIIQDIQHIIYCYGIFDIGEVQSEVSPSLDTRGNLVSLIEDFREDNAIVVVYNDSYSIVDTYRLSYSNMCVDTLKQIHIICLLYEQQQLDLD